MIIHESSKEENHGQPAAIDLPVSRVFGRPEEFGKHCQSGQEFFSVVPEGPSFCASFG